MKRGSVIGPLILIGIGALFLLRNLWPEIPLVDIIAKNWPFVLIAWGGLRLIEILMWAILSKPIPRNGISGGEWMLVFLICIVGGTMYTARHYAAWFPNRPWHEVMIGMGDNYDYTLNAVEKPCAKNCRVLIENFRGNAKITGSKEATTVNVSGHETVRSFQQNEADSTNKQTPLELIPQGDQMIVRTNQDRVSDRTRVTAELEITVPIGASIEGHGRMGDFDIESVNGAVDINSDNAGVRLENIGGDVHVDLRKSDIVRAIGVKGSVDLKGRGQDVELQNIDGQVTVAGTYTGQIQLSNLAKPLRWEDTQISVSCEKLPGQIHMGLGEFTANNLTGPVRLNGRSRDVQISDFTQAMDLTLDRGNIELRPGKTVPKIEVHTRSGDVELALPEGARFDLKASTDRGEARNDFGAPLRVDEAGRGATIVGGSGGPELRLETGRGTVTVRKASADELTVPTPERPTPERPPDAPKAPIRQ
jgi:DUF4097 and DUF4098 domain-containing protein YvlB